MACTLRPAAPLDGAAVLPDELIGQYVKPASQADSVLVDALRDAAIEWVEKRSEIGLTLRPWVATFDRVSSAMQLGRRPVVAVTSVTYTGADGLPVSLAGPLPTDDDGSLRLCDWPVQRTGSPVTVAFTAGYADLSNAPAGLPIAALLMLRHLYDGQAADVPPASVTMLCDQDRGPVIA